MVEFFQNLFKNGLPIVALWIIGGGMGLYVLAAVWTHLSIGPLFWQNLFGANRVALPRLARLLSVQATGVEEANSKALVLVRPGETNVVRLERDRGMIYPVAGRNGLHFTPARCSSCGLCAYVCSTGAVSTHDTEAGYLRRFDLASCIYCGMCEGACPTQAIKLTVNQVATQPHPNGMMVQGEVLAKPCPKCQQKAPRPDLFADRIYNFELPTTEEDEEELTAFQQEERQAFLEQGKLFVQPEAACPECQKQVLVAEEEICK
ncbi:MAG: 4Fe-4S binding protein [Chloroflexi bacterium]|nr:4Fe-4S binding protein [Chloroflexota bacterium]